jgi:hypothetical protein
MSAIAKLDAAIKAVCPIHGVSIGRWDDRSTWRIDFKGEATPEQRAAAQSVVDSFDPTITQDDLAACAIDRIDPLMFDALLTNENKHRALELKQPLTPAEFRAALIARWKALNP